MSPRFKRHAPPSAPGHGYNAFETAWNQEAGCCIIAFNIDGNEAIITIHRKTTRQLQEHYNKMQQ
eukprot:5776346-Ditylum_brightwellii.AAC.1